jgi:leader peptidase (prepilin peptidase)/N-methyltransferase
MLPVEVLFAALLGLAFGSFLNVCIVRLPRGESIVSPGSRCPSCGVAIRPMDNIPLVSWILLRRRGRCCGQPISIRYPLVEAATAVLFVACLLAFGLSTTAVGMAVFSWLLLGLAFMDAATYLLPDAFTLTGAALGIIVHSLDGASHSLSAFHALMSLLSGAAIGGFLLITAFFYRVVRGRHGMGMGDVKLGLMLGTWLGWQLGLVALFLGVMAGAVAGSYLAFARPGRAEALRLPFGAFLSVAGIVTVFTGKPLLAWYLHFFS